jgi:rhodanese-related sulfurtransferase
VKKLFLRLFMALGLVAAMSVQAQDQHLVDASPLSVPGTTAINSAQAKALFDKGAIFIDVRTKRAFDASRIPDAILLDLEAGFSREALAKVAKPNDEVIFYCQGEKCKRTAEASKLAVSWGYTRIYYYREGFPGWKSAGYPVE